MAEEISSILRVQKRTRVLVTWGTKLGGTEGIARIIAEELAQAGFSVVAKPAADVHDASTYQAAVVGGALYANRWHRDARRFVDQNVATLRRVPVWLFSSGPLDASADNDKIPPTQQVAVLMERIGAQGHTTFGGRLAADAKGFPAAAIAKTSSGDFRNPTRIRDWAAEVARALPAARPRVAKDPPARSVGRLLAFGVSGWALCAASMTGLLQIASAPVAFAVRAVVAPLLFSVLSARYFRARGAREPLPTALTWTAIVAVLDASVIAGAVLRDFSMFKSFVGTWLPFGLIFLSTWLTGFLMSPLPWSDPKQAGEQALT